MTIFLRTGFNYDSDKASLESGLACSQDDDMTQQQFAEDADINTIVRRFGLTGELPTNFRPPMYGDFSDVTDFQTAMNAVALAQQQFMQMPPQLRERFANDPQKLMAFLDDDANRDEALKLGLLRTPDPATTTTAATGTTTEGTK